MKHIEPSWSSKFGIIGMSGSGKTHLSRTIQQHYPAVLIVDVLDEYDDGEIAHTFEEFCALWLKHEHSREFRIIYKPDVADPQFDQAFNELLYLVFVRGQVLLVIEEIQEFSTPHSMPGFMKKLLMQGRHRRVAFMFTTQSPGLLNKKIVSQMHYLFLGTIYEANDVDYVARIIGRERADELSAMPPRKFLKFQPGKEIVRTNNDLTE